MYFVQRTGHFTQVCGVFCAENWTFHLGLWCILCKELDILLRFAGILCRELDISPRFVVYSVVCYKQ